MGKVIVSLLWGLWEEQILVRLNPALVFHTRNRGSTNTTIWNFLLSVYKERENTVFFCKIPINYNIIYA